MENGLQQRLIADATLGGLVATRVYPVLLPDDPTLPAVTYQRISTVREYTTTGAVSLSRIRMQFDAWGKTYADAKSVSRAIRTALESYAGTLPDGTLVDTIQLDTLQDLYDSNARLYRELSDYIVFAVE